MKFGIVALSYFLFIGETWTLRVYKPPAGLPSSSGRSWTPKRTFNESNLGQSNPPPAHGFGTFSGIPAGKSASLNNSRFGDSEQSEGSSSPQISFPGNSYANTIKKIEGHHHHHSNPGGSPQTYQKTSASSSDDNKNGTNFNPSFQNSQQDYRSGENFQRPTENSGQIWSEGGTFDRSIGSLKPLPMDNQPLPTQSFYYPPPPPPPPPSDLLNSTSNIYGEKVFENTPYMSSNEASHRLDPSESYKVNYDQTLQSSGLESGGNWQYQNPPLTTTTDYSKVSTLREQLFKGGDLPFGPRGTPPPSTQNYQYQPSPQQNQDYYYQQTAYSNPAAIVGSENYPNMEFQRVKTEELILELGSPGVEKRASLLTELASREDLYSKSSELKSALQRNINRGDIGSAALIASHAQLCSKVLGVDHRIDLGLPENQMRQMSLAAKEAWRQLCAACPGKGSNFTRICSNLPK